MNYSKYRKYQHVFYFALFLAVCVHDLHAKQYVNEAEALRDYNRQLKECRASLETLQKENEKLSRDNADSKEIILDLKAEVVSWKKTYDRLVEENKSKIDPDNCPVQTCPEVDCKTLPEYQVLLGEKKMWDIQAQLQEINKDCKIVTICSDRCIECYVVEMARHAVSLATQTRVSRNFTEQERTLLRNVLLESTWVRGYWSSTQGRVEFDKSSFEQFVDDLIKIYQHPEDCKKELNEPELQPTQTHEDL